MPTRTLARTLIVAGLLAGNANGAININIVQTADDVVASFSGTVDLTGMTHASGGSPVLADGFRGVNASQAQLSMGGSAQFDPYGDANNDGPLSIGTSTELIEPDTNTGDFFGNGGPNFSHDVWVPAGYVSNTSITGSSTWLNTSISDLGLTPETTHDYTFPNDSMTVNVGVPEPSSSAFLLGLGALGLLFLSRGKWSQRFEAVNPNKTPNIELFFLQDIAH